MSITPRLVVLIASLAVPGCTGTDVGNPVVDVDFTLYNDQVPDTGGAAQLRAVGETVSLTSAWVSVDRIRLRDAADCSGSAEVERPGPFAVDLLQPGPIPELTQIEAPSIGYCRFEFRWNKLTTPAPAGAPAELVGASILLSGTRGDGTPFVLRSDRSDELRLDAVGGSFTIDDGTNALFVGFDGARLLAGVDLDSGIEDSEGVIRIENGSNEQLLGVFDDNIEAATELFDDNDDDGALDPEERDPTDIIAD